MKYKRAIKKLISGVNKLIFIKRSKQLDIAHVKRVLIISLFFRGDFLFHTPVIKLLAKIVPDAKIDVWTKTRNSELAANNPDINELLIFDNFKTSDYNDGSKLDLKGKSDFLKSIRRSNYDVVIDLTGTISTAIFCYLSGSKYSIGINNYGFGAAYDKFIDLRPASTEGHLILKYLSVIKSGFYIHEDKWHELLKDFKPKPGLYINEDARLKITAILENLGFTEERPLIVLHTTAGWKEKEWDPLKFSRLMEEIHQKNYNFIFIGDDRDKTNFDFILQNSNLNGKGKFKDRFLKLKFLEVAELISRADVFIGADSAPLHIAGAMETPSIGIFGPTNPDFSNPIGEKHKVIYNKLYCSAAVDMQYCSRNAGKTCPSIDCLNMVKVESVMHLIDNLIDEFKRSKKNKNTSDSL